jgi:hypothetical protein
MEKYYLFTYSPGQPVQKGGKIVLLDKNRKWELVEGVEYIVENPQGVELEKCIIIKSGKFLRVDEIRPTYKVGSPSVSISENDTCISYYVSVETIYDGKKISSDFKKVSFCLGSGSDGLYEQLPQETKREIDSFRGYTAWVLEMKLNLLNSSEDFKAHRGYKKVSEMETLKIHESGRGSSENPKTVNVYKMLTNYFEPAYQEGFQPDVSEEVKEVVKHVATLSLEESGLSYTFSPVWKSPTKMVGYLTVSGEAIQGLVEMPGDGTGSYLEDAMFRGKFELPPNTLADSDMTWVGQGGRICWVYDLTDDLQSNSSVDDPKEEVVGSWVKVVEVNGGRIRYIKDDFYHKEYAELIEASRVRTLNNK